MDTESTLLEKWADDLVQTAEDGFAFGDAVEVAKALRYLADAVEARVIGSMTGAVKDAWNRENQSAGSPSTDP